MAGKGATEAVLNHLRECPTVLKCSAGGIEAEPFYQKPSGRSGWRPSCWKLLSGRSPSPAAADDVYARSPQPSPRSAGTILRKV
jgi:hypothetical protein